jgi:hypothetical protein
MAIPDDLRALAAPHLAVDPDDRIARALVDAAATIERQAGELAAARFLAARLNDRRFWTAGTCPCCGFGRKLDGTEFHGTGCVLAAYNEVAARLDADIKSHQRTTITVQPQ